MQEFFWFGIFAGGNRLILVALAGLVSWRRVTPRVPHGDGEQALAAALSA